VPGVSHLWLSSIGLGTYLVIQRCRRSLVHAAIEAGLRSGANVLGYCDQLIAINFQNVISGRCSSTWSDPGNLHRDEVLVCTKGGYLSFDGNPPPDPRPTSIASTSRRVSSIPTRWRRDALHVAGIS